jgi:hypothetical protein
MDLKNASSLTRDRRHLVWVTLLALPLTGLTAGRCQGGSVAVALNKITDFTIAGLPATARAANMTSNSADFARLFPPGGFAGDHDPINAPPACVNCKFKDSYEQHAGDLFAYGDSQIKGQGTGKADPLLQKASFYTIAEVHLNKTGDGNAEGSVSFVINMYNPTENRKLDFSFWSTPKLKVELTKGTTAGSFAEASLTFGIIISKKDPLSEMYQIVDQWYPDQLVRPGELLGDFSLNKLIGVRGPGPASDSYDPTLKLLNFFHWEVSLNATGDYRIEITDEVKAKVEDDEANAVGGGGGGKLRPNPEPSTLTLLGLGAVTLLGHGWRRRRLAAKRSAISGAG